MNEGSSDDQLNLKVSDKQLWDDIRNSFNSVEDYNRVWEYSTANHSDKEQWAQFDCSECLVLEFSFKAYGASGLQDRYRTVEIQ